MALACKPSTNWAIDPGEGPFYQIAPRRVLAYAEASFPDSAADCRIHPVVILSAMSTDTPMPLQLSSSWTWKPADPGTDDPYFMKMAAQGQSFFQASGDN